MRGRGPASVRLERLHSKTLLVGFGFLSCFGVVRWLRLPGHGLRCIRRSFLACSRSTAAPARNGARVSMVSPSVSRSAIGAGFRVHAQARVRIGWSGVHRQLTLEAGA